MVGDSHGEGPAGVGGLAPAPCGAWRWRPSAGADEAGALACRAAPPRLLRAAWGAHVDAAARSSDGKNWYTVNVRWLPAATGEGGPLAAHAICSCPDKRQGYCKHAAAVLQAAAAQRGAACGGDEAPWLRAAYGAPREAASDLEVLPLPASVLRRVELFRAEERALDLLGAEGTAALLLGTIMAPRSSEPGVPDDGEVLSRLFGGEDAASEAYQLMTATRAFDAMRRLKAAGAARARWAALVLLYDVQSASFRARLRAALLSRKQLQQEQPGQEEQREREEQAGDSREQELGKRIAGDEDSERDSKRPRA
jgi:hypothetical protein